jgi:hypothetical protein
MSAAAGAPQLTAQFPGSTIGARVSQKNVAAREAVAADLGVTETPVVMDAVDDSLIAAGFGNLSLTDLEGGRRRMRGGGKIGDALVRIKNNIKGRLSKAAERTEQDLVTAIDAIETGGNALADASSKLGRFSLMGAATAATVAAINATARTLPSPTWAQLGMGIAAFFKEAFVELPKALALGAATNPLIAIAIGSGIMKFRARRRGITVQQLLEADAEAFTQQKPLKDILNRLGPVNTGIDLGVGFESGPPLEEGKEGPRTVVTVPGRIQPSNYKGALSKIATPLSRGTGKLSRDAHEAVRKAVANMTPDQREELKRATEKLPKSYNAQRMNDAELLLAVKYGLSPREAEEEAAVIAPPPNPSASSSLSSSSAAAGEGTTTTRSSSTLRPRAASSSGRGGRRKTKKGKKAKRRVTQRMIRFAY